MFDASLLVVLFYDHKKLVMLFTASCLRLNPTRQLRVMFKSSISAIK
jgi:hypothetical protein